MAGRLHRIGLRDGGAVRADAARFAAMARKRRPDLFRHIEVAGDAAAQDPCSAPAHSLPRAFIRSFQSLLDGLAALAGGPAIWPDAARHRRFRFGRRRGAIIAPIVGRAADRGGTRLVNGVAIAAVAFSFILAWIGGAVGSAPLLATAGVVLDMGATANLVLSQRILFVLGSEARSRLNATFIAAFFLGGAVGSAVSSFTFAKGGWPLTTATGFAFALAAFAFYLTEPHLFRKA
jgi:MFS family permease